MKLLHVDLSAHMLLLMNDTSHSNSLVEKEHEQELKEQQIIAAQTELYKGLTQSQHYKQTCSVFTVYNDRLHEGGLTHTINKFLHHQEI